jgi:type IVB pilus formation R64 PilN family outer membrane protein
MYSGSLTGFMNLVAAYYGVYWRTEGSALRIFLLDSRTFRIAALPGDTRLFSSVDAGANTGGGGAAGTAGPAGGAGTATQSGSTMNSTGVGFAALSVWTAIESAIRQMLGPGGKVVASPATGTVTVTDTPVVLERVSEYIADQNKALNRQVSVNVRVLSVELNEGETYGIQWDAVYQKLTASSPYAIGFKTAATTAEGVGNLILSAPATSSSRWAGSSALVSALSTQGRVTELTSATVVTLNNQPVPVNVGHRVSYLASSSVTQTANVGSTTSLTPGTVSTGFSMTLVPHIVDGRELLLQYSMDLSSLLQMKTISSGGNTIEAPDVSTSSFIQRVRLASNETLVVAGFDQDNLSAVAEGVGHPQNTLMGNRNGSTKRTMLVILIQPVLSL